MASEETLKKATNDLSEEKPKRKRRNPFRIEQQKEEKERRQKKKSRLIVRNISYKATEQDLRTHFGQWGEIEEINLLKRADGKLVGCAFIQYLTINQATKAILKGNSTELLGRPIFVDWALGKDEYVRKQSDSQKESEEKKAKIEIKNEVQKEEIQSQSDDGNEEEEEANNEKECISDSDDEKSEMQLESEEDDEKKELNDKINIEKVAKQKNVSNDVKEGCTIFIKNLPFEAEEADLRKVCRKYGPISYALINRQPISGHSKGTAFVKFKSKESADMCLQAGSELTLMDEILQPFPALSKEEIREQTNENKEEKDRKDSRNLYLAREGLIMAGSKAAESVSASDMNKRHKLEQLKAQVLKNLNRFVSRNRLSIHNLPLNYNNDNLRDMVITYTGFKPHECRVMRENSITREHPKGKSKGFGFMSFKTHQEALLALRKLNNNPNIFTQQHRPIVAFSIEDRGVHKIKEKRTEKSKLNNPTFKQKMEKLKIIKGEKLKRKISSKAHTDDKEKLKTHIKNLEKSRSAKNGNSQKALRTAEEPFVGATAKAGTLMRMRSLKKIKEQSETHMKRVKNEKKKTKQARLKQSHLAERKAKIRPKQGHKKEKDDLAPLVNKYKKLLDNRTSVNNYKESNIKQTKRTRWYTE
uniref:RRM domain-containing protein n=1 Tax=Glossina brevipalpis TaxID=37001 RepID=A0A1A9WK30_9MUSC